MSAWVRLGAAPVGVLALVGVLYTLKWIPPVPLSMQYGGVYHTIAKSGDRYQLTYVKPPWYAFWRHDDRIFLVRPGDSLNCFFRVFAPTRFSHQLTLEWLHRDARSGRLQSQDRIPIEIVGGRDNGFRGVAVKSNYEPGDWRVDVETADGRMIGSIPFEVRLDESQDPREWRTREM